MSSKVKFGQFYQNSTLKIIVDDILSFVKKTWWLWIILVLFNFVAFKIISS